jgi:hypothetical protein
MSKQKRPDTPTLKPIEDSVSLAMLELNLNKKTEDKVSAATVNMHSYKSQRRKSEVFVHPAYGKVYKPVKRVKRTPYERGECVSFSHSVNYRSSTLTRFKAPPKKKKEINKETIEEVWKEYEEEKSILKEWDEYKAHVGLSFEQ